MIRIVADDKIPFLKGALEPFAEVEYVPGHLITSEQLASAQGLITRTRTKCNAELLNNTAVKFIATATIGFDHIDTGYCAAKGIKWTTAPGCNSGSVQQYIASVLMGIEIKLEEKQSLSDLTIGIIGVGNVGRKVEKLARTLGMNVQLNDPPRARAEGHSAFVNLDILLETSDIVTLHVPLCFEGIDKTFHLVNNSFLKKMKPQSWLINSTRGEVCNTTDLKDAHVNGILNNLILDVWENEPDIDLELLKKCFIGTPHIAGYSVDGKANGTSTVVNACSRFFGLDLQNWYPANLPLPKNCIVDLSSAKLSDNDIIRNAILASFDVRADDHRLRATPASFEKLRGDYPPRREFPVYTIKLDGSRKKLSNVLKEIGFNVNDQ